MDDLGEGRFARQFLLVLGLELSLAVGFVFVLSFTQFGPDEGGVEDAAAAAFEVEGAVQLENMIIYLPLLFHPPILNVLPHHVVRVHGCFGASVHPLHLLDLRRPFIPLLIKHFRNKEFGLLVTLLFDDGDLFSDFTLPVLLLEFLGTFGFQLFFFLHFLLHLGLEVLFEVLFHLLTPQRIILRLLRLLLHLLLYLRHDPVPGILRHTLFLRGLELLADLVEAVGEGAEDA